MLACADHELERLYARTLGSGMRSLAVTACNPGEGVSSVAVALAQRHLLAGRSALFVDLNSDKQDHRPILEPVNEALETTPVLISDPGQSYALLGISPPTTGNAGLKWRNPGYIEQLLGQWLESFDAVIIDAGPFRRAATATLPVERILAASEACLMVVLAGVTTAPMVRQCQRTMAAHGATLVGSVLNNRFNPSLKDEIARESRRLPRFLNGFGRRIRRWLDENRLLSLEL